MSFNLLVVKNRDDRKYESLDLDSCYIAADIYNKTQDIIEYNDLFSKIISESNGSMHYLISPTLTRVEGQTLFYDKVVKYIYLVSFIENAQGNIMIKGLDFIIFEALLDYLRNKKIKCEYRPMLRASQHIFQHFKFVLRVILNIFRESAILAAARLIIGRVKERVYDYVIISFYDYRSNLKGKYRDHYFAPLIDYMIKNKKKVMVFVTLLNKNSPCQILQYIKEISKIENSPSVKLCHQFISPFDIFRACFMGLFIRITLNQNLIFKDRDITFLANLSLKSEYHKCTWFFPLTQYLFFKRMFKDISFGNLLYPYENHPWEKLLIRVRNQTKSDIRLIAFQHTSFSFKLINHFPGIHETDLPIFPDKIFTAGKMLKSVLEGYGHYPEGVLQEGCALRHDYLFDEDINNEVGPEKERKLFNQIAYAFSFDTSNYNTVLRNLILIFKDAPYKILLKLHPLSIKSFSVRKDLPNNFILASSISWKDLFRQIDMVLYDDNSLGIEALKYNVEPVYFPFTGQIYDTDRLFKYDNRGFKKNASLQEFRNSIDRYYSGYNNLNWPKKTQYNRQYLYAYFSPVTEERMKLFLHQEVP